MKRLRIVFLGTPEFALPALEQMVRSEHQVLAVYTQPDRPAGRGQAPSAPPVKLSARRWGLPVLQPDSLKNPEEAERLAGLRPELLVVAAYGKLLPRPILDIPPLGCLNIHPSLLPRHRGASPVAAAILAGDSVTGVTIMLLDEGMDTGPILTQVSLTISSEDTTDTLTEKLAKAGALLLQDTLPRWQAGSLVPQPQSEEKATYSRLITKEDGEIDWHLSAREIWRRVRAFQSWPGCRTRWKGKQLKVLQAIALPQNEGSEPGEVIALRTGRDAEVGVQTGEGVLGLLRVQLEGKRVLSATEFLHGQKDFPGSRLPC